MTSNEHLIFCMLNRLIWFTRSLSRLILV